MLVVGKPGSPSDVYNTGYVKSADLLQYFIKANK